MIQTTAAEIFIHWCQSHRHLGLELWRLCGRYGSGQWRQSSVPLCRFCSTRNRLGLLWWVLVYSNTVCFVYLPLACFVDSIYTERYMSLPKLNEVGYANSQLTTRAQRLRGKKFMLIHGTLDDNVHYQQAMVLAKNLERLDILFKQIVSIVRVFSVFENYFARNKEK